MAAAFAEATPAPAFAPSDGTPASAWIPYDPVRLDPWAVAAVNRLCRQRDPLVGVVEGLPVSLRTEPTLLGIGSYGRAGVPAYDLVWSLDNGEAAVVTLPCDVVGRLLTAVEPELIGMPQEPARSLLIELALAPWLHSLEGALGTRLTLVETSPAPHPSIRPRCVLAFAGALAGVPFEAILQIGSPGTRDSGLERLTRVVAARPAAAGTADALAQVPFDLAVHAGAMRLRVTHLRGLEIGDVLVPDDFPFEHGCARVAVGGRAALAQVEGDALHLQDRLRRIQPSSRGVSMSDDSASETNDTEEDSTFGDLDVAIVFELGRCQVDLATLSSIAPGYVFPLARDPAGPIDILANGRRIGRGEIVRVGETLGVRVTRLFGHG